MLKNSEANGTEEIGLVAPTPGAETGILRANKTNKIATDALAHFVTRTLEAIGIDWEVLVFNQEGFQLRVPPHCREMIENGNIFSCLIEKNSTRRDLKKQ